MPDAFIPLSERPGFIHCKMGEHLTEEQRRLVFSGSNAIWNKLADDARLALAAAVPAPAANAEPTTGASTGAVALGAA